MSSSSPPVHPAKRRKIGNAGPASADPNDPLNLFGVNSDEFSALPSATPRPRGHATLLQYIEGAYQPTGRLAKERVREILEHVMSGERPGPRETDTITLLYALDHLEASQPPAASQLPPAARLVSLDNMRRNMRCHIKGERLLPCSAERCLFGVLCRRFAHPLDPLGQSVGLALVHDEQWAAELNQPGLCLLCLLHWVSDVATSARELRKTYAHTINPIRVSQNQGDSISNEHLLFSPLIEGAVPFFSFPDYTAALYDTRERCIVLDPAKRLQEEEGQSTTKRYLPALFPKWRLFRRGSRIPRLIRRLGQDDPFVVDLPLPLSTSLLPHTQGTSTTTSTAGGPARAPTTLNLKKGTTKSTASSSSSAPTPTPAPAENGPPAAEVWVFSCWADMLAWVRETGYPSGFLGSPVVRDRVVLSPLVVPHAKAPPITTAHPFFGEPGTGRDETRPDEAMREFVRGIKHPLPLSDPHVCRAHSLYWAAVGGVNTLLHLATRAWPGTRHRDFLMERADALGPLLGELARIGAGRPPTDAECDAAWRPTRKGPAAAPVIPEAFLPRFPSTSPCDVCCEHVERELFLAPHAVHEPWEASAHTKMEPDPHRGLPDLADVLHSLLSPAYAPHLAWDVFLLRRPVEAPDHALTVTASTEFIKAVLLLLQEELVSPEAEVRFAGLRIAHPTLMRGVEAASTSTEGEGSFPCRDAVLRYLARLVRDRPLLSNLLEQRFVFLASLLAVVGGVDTSLLWMVGPRRAPYTVLRQVTIDLGRFFYESGERLEQEMEREVKGTVDPALVQHTVKVGRLFRALLDADREEVDDVEVYLVTLGLLLLAGLGERLAAAIYAITLDALGGRYLPERCLEVVQAVSEGTIPYQDVLLLRLLLEAFSGELNKCIVRLRRPETAKEQAGDFAHRGVGGLVPGGIYARDFFNRCTSLFYCPATMEAHSRRSVCPHLVFFF